MLQKHNCGEIFGNWALSWNKIIKTKGNKKKYYNYNNRTAT